ncbi:MAG: restriction endonuclease subunit S [Sphaerospermopsis kisseleviana]
MGKYQGYDKYKDSGVEWLGDIPEHWEVTRFKFLLSEPFKYGANEAAEINDPDLPRYIRITDVKDDGSLRDDTFRSLPENIAKDYLLEEGDILLARSGATVGKTFIYRKSWGKAAYAGYLIRGRVSGQNNSDFIYKFLQSKFYWDWVNSIFIQATIQNISAEKYANLSISIPPLQEQQKIANYLDQKTAQIEEQKTKIKKAIDLLKEYRTALITNTVTGKIDVRKIPIPN